ncbi:hypothetical protein ACHAW5_008674 [Stephanodiscus triporus]|uniref:Uncharacterized protein n=1 Tax=Stephanodiscus triporus TaxID=2934178 RepID=A0ABD3QNB0_9STRA
MDLQDQLWRWRGRPEQQQRHVPKSPACHPHFRYFSNETSRAWSDDTKFQRLYFYHARKAGGTSLANYFAMVAHHHGLKFEHAEWFEAEEPGTHELPTFYVTHLREPVDRSISHFKCQCAVNCYIQWFSGACPEFDIPIEEQFQMAKTKLLRYNFIVVVEWLSDPEYASAVESFFGVPGVTARRSAYCEHSSHKANKLVPLTIENHTLDKLSELNVADINLYKDLTDCLDEDDDQGYNFPQLDAGRFDNTSSVQVHYSEYMEWKRKNNDRRKQRENPEKVKTSIDKIMKETNEDEI